ncbi:hypothetical protein [Pontibacter mangrovi]|uniref:GAF domain-containing protein n=1 Tax=Pontibacter mangrovi TaxID=2589816 RepID=A0A501WD79_9BACT|nr:hypothetical protein [Pontibacter mangrovi]TPE43446.1 hypothetical protein FJM65_11830 [Pontibacter mangrovi]
MDSSPAAYFEKELQEFKEALGSAGIHGALRYLSHRTPHRFTGIYRYDGEMLRNVAIFDKYDPALKKGEDAPMKATYCSLLQVRQALEIMDATEDERVKGLVVTPVTSYYGVLMRDAHGRPFGSLCHFDMKRCQERLNDFPLLEAAAKVLYDHLLSGQVEG